MTLLLLIRHGENDYVKTGKLAGRLPGVHLNTRGKAQADALGEGLKNVSIKAVYSSPLERALETAMPIAARHQLRVIEEPGLLDADVGEWQESTLKMLSQTEAWKIVQQSPSRFRFPGGESFPEIQTRITGALEGIIKAHPGTTDIIAVVFHADPIKLAVAHYLGMPMDHFQRLGCDTGSLSLLAVDEAHAALLKLNLGQPFRALDKLIAKYVETHNQLISKKQAPVNQRVK